jgi:hypothetical protein
MILPPFLFMMHLMMQMHSRDHQPTRRKVGVGFLYHPASWARHRRQCEPGRSVAQCYGLTRAGRLRGTESANPKVYRIVALKATTLGKPLTMSRLDHRTKVLA